jgi:ribonuclease HIII
VTMQLPRDQTEKFRKHLESKGFSFEKRPHQIFLARNEGVVVNLYENGKIVFGGNNYLLIEEIRDFLLSIGAKDIKRRKKEYPPIEVSGTRIGTDEVGKGDYYGPLVIGGILITEDKEEKISKLGIKDSKRLSETTISNLAIKIREILNKKEYEVIWISPIKYNILYNDLGNLNKILGWGHARTIENLLDDGKNCKIAIADQFGDQSYIERALMRKGRQIRLIQVPHAERDLAVAAASVLAREMFNQKFQEMCDSYGIQFPKGASLVIEFGKQLVKEYGIDVLRNVAKVHFSITQKIIGDFTPQIDRDIEVDLESVPKDIDQKEIEDTRLECFSLITGFEKELRKFIKRELEGYYGSSWWEQGVDENIRKKCEKLAGREINRGREVSPLDCLSFSHYDFILMSKKNWEHVFSKVFTDKQTLLGRLKILKNVRDPAAHARGAFRKEEKLEVVSTIKKLRNLMNRQQDLDSYGVLG